MIGTKKQALAVIKNIIESTDNPEILEAYQYIHDNTIDVADLYGMGEGHTKLLIDISGEIN